jgi:hypothetical protein
MYRTGHSQLPLFPQKPLTLALPKRRTAQRERELIGGCSGATPTCDTALNPILNSKWIFQVAVFITNNTVSPLPEGEGTDWGMLGSYADL